MKVAVRKFPILKRKQKVMIVVFYPISVTAPIWSLSSIA
jgi:hypothetical protein